MSSYNYDSFSSDQYDLANFSGPNLGEKAPDAIFSMVDGSTRRLLDFDNDFLVIETGSVTCPLFQSRRGGMAQLSRNHHRAKFVVMYVREAHPGAQIKQHQDMADKQACAAQLNDNVDDRREMLVDDIEGSAHAAYGSFPNAVFIVNRNGCIVFMSDWNDPNATGQALRLLEEGRPADVRSFFKPATPKVGMATFKRSGKGSGLDFAKGFPVLFWQNIILRNLRIMRGKQVVIKPDAYC